MSDMLKNIVEKYPDETFVKADGLDEALIGVDESSMRLIYSVSKCLEILEKDMDAEQAVEYFDFNTRGTYIGLKTPIWCDDVGI